MAAHTRLVGCRTQVYYLKDYELSEHLPRNLLLSIFPQTCIDLRRGLEVRPEQRTGYAEIACDETPTCLSLCARLVIRAFARDGQQVAG